MPTARSWSGISRGTSRALDADSRRRLGGNPLRILDSKNPAMQELIAGAPLLTEHLDAESRAHFDGARARMLDDVGIPYTINPRLVRGLDYYIAHGVRVDHRRPLGAQNAVCSGGRYDGLIAQLGGEATPGSRFRHGCRAGGRAARGRRGHARARLPPTCTWW